MSEICLSLVSHAQAELANPFLVDLARYCPDIDLVVTSNIPEVAEFDFSKWPGATHVINPASRGFSANHNAAFSYCNAKYFCIANPDIRINSNLFPSLISMMQDPLVGVVAPRVLNASGGTEDSVRRFPTPLSLLGRLLAVHDDRYPIKDFNPISVDWAAGMFLLFRAEAFDQLSGFDENFFLYFEDIDICKRLWKSNWKVMIDPRVSVIHLAQRASRKNFQHFCWHLSSMFRYFLKHYGRLPR